MTSAVLSGYSPGVRTVTESEYFADPALSSSGARRILPPSCPAIFAWEQAHGRPEKRAFDYGHAAHKQVLGVGATLRVVDADDWRTKAAREQQAAAYSAGCIPILAADAVQVEQMAAAVRTHPLASALLDTDHGMPEQSIFWRDDKHGVDRRARLDWLPEPVGGRLIVADYKTTRSAAPAAIAKSMHDYGYHQQHAWYVDAVASLGIAEDIAFAFIFQEKTPPYLITVAELDSTAVQVGRGLNDRALEVYAECTATREWPGHTTDIELISLPAWALTRHQELVA